MLSILSCFFVYFFSLILLVVVGTVVDAVSVELNVIRDSPYQLPNNHTVIGEASPFIMTVRKVFVDILSLTFSLFAVYVATMPFVFFVEYQARRKKVSHSDT